MTKPDKYTPSDQPFHSDPKYWSKLKSRAREMRHEPTLAENMLWQRLRNRRIKGAKFRRQYAIGPFVVDFCCIERKVVIEVDGEIHQSYLDEDVARQAFIVDQGFDVLLFTNDQVMSLIDNVCDQFEVSWLINNNMGSMRFL